MGSNLRVGATPTSPTMSVYRTPILNPDKNLQAYIIGVAISDGNLSNPNKGGAVRLRISCDKRYPRVLKRIVNALRRFLPKNRVGIIDRGTLVDVSIYSNHLEKLLGWKANKGPKFIQKIKIPEWIKNNKSYAINCLRGLLETDGSIYSDRGYKMVIFSTLNKQLAKDVFLLFHSLGYSPHLYKIKQKQNRYGIGCKYHVRLSKNVDSFIKIVGIDKS